MRDIHGITLVGYGTSHVCIFLFMTWLKCELSLRYKYKYNMDTFLCQILQNYKKIYHNFDFNDTPPD
jgi:hypothetical protein